MLNLRKVLGAKPKEHVESQLAELLTPWGEALDADHVLEEHPDPFMRREAFQTLNGRWRCAECGEKYNQRKAQIRDRAKEKAACFQGFQGFFRFPRADLHQMKTRNFMKCVIFCRPTSFYQQKSAINEDIPRGKCEQARNHACHFADFC